MIEDAGGSFDMVVVLWSECERGQSDLGIIVPYYHISRDYRTWISKKVDIVKEYSVKEREKHKERV